MTVSFVILFTSYVCALAVGVLQLRLVTNGYHRTSLWKAQRVKIINDL